MVHHSSKREVRERRRSRATSRAASSTGTSSAEIIPLPGKKRQPPPSPPPGFADEATASAIGESPFEGSNDWLASEGLIAGGGAAGAEVPEPPPLPTKPKLEVVPKASWPFEQDRKASISESQARSRPRIKQKTPVRGASSKPRTDSKLVVWNNESAQEKEKSGEKRVPTAVNIQVPVGLPPATEETNSRGFKLRRSESVIAEAEAMRGGVAKKMQVLSRRASTSFRDAIAGGFEAVSYLGEGSIRAVRKFESMPRRRQIMWVATPYAVVILLVLLLVHLRSPGQPTSSQPVQIKRPITETDRQIAEPQLPAEAAQPLPVPDPVPVRVPVLPKEIVAEPVKISGVWQEVHALTFLRTRAEAKGTKVARLERGQKVVVYQEMPSKDGWLVAQKPGAEIGFLKASVLQPREDSAAEKPVKKIAKKKAKAKKRRLAPLPL